MSHIAYRKYITGTCDGIRSTFSMHYILYALILERKTLYIRHTTLFWWKAPYCKFGQSLVVGIQVSNYIHNKATLMNLKHVRSMRSYILLLKSFHYHSINVCFFCSYYKAVPLQLVLHSVLPYHWINIWTILSVLKPFNYSQELLFNF
jgi:hypothetical protein